MGLSHRVLVKNHQGGIDKAVHHYPLDLYPAWLDELGRILAVLSRERSAERG